MTQINFEKMGGLIPAVIQDHENGQLLMLGFMDEAALTKTIAEQRVTFFSRSKQRLWTKGETSQNTLGFCFEGVAVEVDKLFLSVDALGRVGVGVRV